MEKAKIKLLPGGIMPTKGTKGAAAWDCYAADDVIVRSEPTLIRLGFALELPEGYHAKVLPRSSIGLNTSLRMSNSFGLIDSDYRGEVNAIYETRIIYDAINNEATETFFVIRKGDRIAQMMIEKNEDVELVSVNEIGETERGSGGFGSTGK